MNGKKISALYSVLFYLLLPTSGSVLSWRSWRRVGRINITYAGKQVKIGGHASPEGDGKWGFWYQEPNGSGKGFYYFRNDSVEILNYTQGSTSWIPVEAKDDSTIVIKIDETSKETFNACRISVANNPCETHINSAEIDTGYVYDGQCLVNCYHARPRPKQNFDILILNEYGRFLSGMLQ